MIACVLSGYCNIYDGAMHRVSLEIWVIVTFKRRNSNVDEASSVLIRMDRSNKYNDDYTNLEWAIELHRYMLTIVGLWPQSSQQIKDEYKKFSAKFRMLLNVFILSFVLIIPTVAHLIKVWGDLLQTIENLQFSLPFLVTELKIFIMWHKKEVLSMLINMVIKDWTRVKMDEERNVMLEKARIARLLLKLGVFVTALAVFIRLGSVFFIEYIWHANNDTNHKRALPILTYYWYDLSSSPKYELAYLAQTIGCCLATLTYMGIDDFLALLILHICGQLENLHLRLLNLGKDPDFKAALKYNVKDHIRLIRSVEVIDNTFNLMLLSVIGFFCIFFSLQGFLALNANRDNHLPMSLLLFYIFGSLCVLIHTCLYCVAGELLVIQNEKIHRVTCECIWYTLEPKEARNLTLIMVCAKKPLNITAGKIFPMTMSTFCNILKTSAGYISMLLAVRN
ncbi:odorant receptor 43a isoform X2 [Solenopsis invicta]|uniref:odorant receptor 43a isoform X2 n=1 Tax=Solenopsis invicta TaxID=13686 RepID=UPI00193DB014|nr:odorant receptor 43a isoform X2 [Solenopsis invicta]